MTGINIFKKTIDGVKSRRIRKFFGARKKTATDEPPPEQKPSVTTLSSKGPQAVSAAVKARHGQRLQGSALLPNGTGLQLDASQSARTIPAFAGRYAIIKPEIAKGEVATTGKMALVFEFTDGGVPGLEAWEYKVIKVNSNNIILTDDSYGYVFSYRFEK